MAHKTDTEMTEDQMKERIARAAQLDKDLDDFIEKEMENTRRRRLENPQPEQTVEEILEEMSTHPAFLTEIDYTKPLHPATEALIALQYETDDAQDLAEKYKIDGNDNFKRSRYRWAIENYTEGIRAECADRLLNAILHANRSASHYHLGNYRSSLNDAIVARKLQPSHLKAIIRGAQCCHKLVRLDDCLKWCAAGLLIDPENVPLLALKELCTKDKNIEERDRRKKETKERKLIEDKQKLRDTIKGRGIRVSKDGQVDLTCPHPDGKAVYIAADDSLVWPVMFLYPEHSQTDFIQAMGENTRFIDQLETMFGAGIPSAPWDENKNYTIQHIQLFFNDEEADTLVKLDTNMTLLQALQHKRYILSKGTPTFVVLSDASPFYEKYMERTCR